MLTPNQILFLETYKDFLIKNQRENPQDYAWSINELPEVLLRMRKAILNNTFNKDSYSFKMTCKKLKIKHTYKDIEMFLGQI